MRHITQDALNLIKQFEGFSKTVYFCSANHPIIGYGHAVKEHENFACGVSEEEAEDLLLLDIDVVEREVLRLISAPLNDSQFDALVSFTYSIGGGALQYSNLRCRVNREEHTKVPAEFMRWVWGEGQKLEEFINRREVEAKLYQRTT